MAMTEGQWRAPWRAGLLVVAVLVALGGRRPHEARANSPAAPSAATATETACVTVRDPTTTRGNDAISRLGLVEHTTATASLGCFI